MGLQIPITGVPADWRRPGGYLELLFNQGPAGAFAPGRECVLVMPMTSSGNWTANTLYPIPNAVVAETGAGPGSPLHRAALAFRTYNKDAKLWGVPYSASSGGSPAVATGTVAITATVTSPGSITVWICNEPCTASYIVGDTATVIGEALEAAINAKTHLPVTANNVTGTVTISYKIAGASGGTAGLPAVRLYTEITLGTGVSAVTSAHVGAVVAGADGTTTEAANQLSALNTLATRRLYWMGISTQAATEYGQLKTHIQTKSEPRRGHRSAGIGAYTGALSDAQTIAIARNYERLSLGWALNSPNDPAWIVGVLMAFAQKLEDADKAYNFDGVSLSEALGVPYPGLSRPSSEDINDAINDGLLPIGYSEAGAFIEMFTTTRSKNAAGTLDDPRSLERHRISVGDEFSDEELVAFGLNYSGKKLAADELLANGKVNPNQLIPPGVVTPNSFKPHIKARVDDFVSRALLQDAQASKDSLRVVKTGSRLEVGMDLYAIDLLHQATYRFAESSSG